jgi:multidrug efflux pump subunit AcrB
MTRAALKNPCAIVVISLITAIFGRASYRKMAVDIVAEFNLPVVAVVTF